MCVYKNNIPVKKNVRVIFKSILNSKTIFFIANSIG